MHDESTAALMKAFYQQLAKVHEPAEALHFVKLNWLTQKQSSFGKLPYFWAGLIYVGDNRPVVLTAKSSWVNWKWITVVVIVLSGLVYSVLKIKKKKTAA